MKISRAMARKSGIGVSWDSNPGPLAFTAKGREKPEARIIPLDHTPEHFTLDPFMDITLTFAEKIQKIIQQLFIIAFLNVVKQNVSHCTWSKTFYICSICSSETFQS